MRRLLATVLLGCCAVAAAPATEPPPPEPAWAAEVAPRVDFEAAMAALAADEPRLAAELLADLRDGARGLERRSYEALLLVADRRPAEAGVEIQAILSEPGASALPAWLLSELIAHRAGERLAERRAEAERRLAEVLARHHQAVGGLEDLRSLTGMIARGTVEAGGARAAFRLVRKRPGFYRLDLETPAGPRIEATDGQGAWRLLPPYGAGDGGILEGEEERALVDNSHFDDVLVRYRETGEQLHLAGVEIVDGSESDRIEVDEDSRHRFTIFLDRATGLEVRRLVWSATGEPPTVIRFEHGEFEGRTLPARQVVESANGVVAYVFDSYSFDSSIDPSAFQLEDVRRRAAARSGDPAAATPDP